jgi:iron complex outermembrane receptor protein
MATAAFLPATAAYAQQAGAPSRGQAANTIEEVIVTAERRESRLQDVPISVTALSAQTLERANITNTRDLALVTPGLRIEATGIFVEPNIRGITTTLSFPAAEPNVATYVDGVYMQNMLLSFYELPDVRQVEVLKGPQGTLFGRNATGGAILVNSLQPNLTAPTGSGSISYGRYNSITAKAYFSMPIIDDKLAFSVTAYTMHHDSWQHNVLENNKRDGSKVDSDLVRGKIRFKPWDGADFTLAGLYTHTSDFDQLRGSNLNGNNVNRALGVPPSLIASTPYTFSQEYDSFTKTSQRMVSLNGDIRVGPGTLTTITSYRRQRDYVPLDGDNGPLPLAQTEVNSRSQAFSQELIYNTDQLGKFRGTFGLFYYHFNGQFLPLNINHFAQTIWNLDKTRAYAGFGEMSYNITDRLVLTAGARFSYEKKWAYAAFQVGSSVRPSPIPLLGVKDWHSLTPKASVLYKVTDTTNVYFTYSQGFKSGLFNTVSFQAEPIDPEKVKAYELGVKSRITPNLSINGAGFYYDYTGLQVPTILQRGAVFLQVVRNAANARIHGIELNADWRVTEEFRISAGGTWLHARYKSFPNASLNTPSGFGGNTTIVADVSGFHMVRSPDWSGSITPSYTKETSSGTFDVTGTFFYSSTIYFDPGQRVKQKGYETINASAGWKMRDTGLELRIWGKNLTDKAVIDSTVISNAADLVHYAAPRTFGVEAKYSF